MKNYLKILIASCSIASTFVQSQPEIIHFSSNEIVSITDPMLWTSLRMRINPVFLTQMRMYAEGNPLPSESPLISCEYDQNNNSLRANISSELRNYLSKFIALNTDKEVAIPHDLFFSIKENRDEENKTIYASIQCTVQASIPMEIYKPDNSVLNSFNIIKKIHSLLSEASQKKEEPKLEESAQS